MLDEFAQVSAMKPCVWEPDVRCRGHAVAQPVLLEHRGDPRGGRPRDLARASPLKTHKQTEQRGLALPGRPEDHVHATRLELC